MLRCTQPKNRLFDIKRIYNLYYTARVQRVRRLPCAIYAVVAFFKYEKRDPYFISICICRSDKFSTGLCRRGWLVFDGGC